MTIDTLDQELIVAEIDKVAHGISQCYDQFSPRTKAASLELAHHMAALRSKLAPSCVEDGSPSDFVDAGIHA